MFEHSMEGVWHVTDRSSYYLGEPTTWIEQGEDPWSRLDRTDYSNYGDGYEQQAERFIPAYHGHTFYGPNGDPDTYNLKNPFVRQVVGRTLHNPCNQCDGRGGFDTEYDHPAGPLYGTDMEACMQCDARGWYWQTTGEHK